MSKSKCRFRSKFNTWKRSREAFEVSRSLIRKSLYLCPICKISLSLGEGHLFHIIPIRLLKEHNAITLVTNELNLLYSCKPCNLKQGTSIYTPNLEDELLILWRKTVMANQDKKELPKDYPQTVDRALVDKIVLKPKEKTNEKCT